MGLRRPCDVVGGALARRAGEAASGWGGPGGCAEKATGLKRTSTARLAGNAQGRSLGRGQTRRAGWAGPLHMTVQGYSAGMCRGTAHGCVMHRGTA